jgi:hypothetical protein
MIFVSVMADAALASDGEGELRDPDHTIKFLKEMFTPTCRYVAGDRGERLCVFHARRAWAFSLLTPPDLLQFRTGLTRL